jgi:branched-chain amino acid transport system permease protein
MRVRRTQTIAFVVSAGCAGLGGGLLCVVLQLATPGAFPLQLSLALLTGVVVGGLGSLVGAIWGAALLVLLPSWSNDIANALSVSTNVKANLPLAIYGLVLIAAILVWPTGIQGGVQAVGRWLRGVWARGHVAQRRARPDAGRGAG